VDASFDLLETRLLFWQFGASARRIPGALPGRYCGGTGQWQRSEGAGDENRYG
jgi:hypothetical protein